MVKLLAIVQEKGTIKLGIFDSGVGGFSVFSEVTQKLPGLSIHYFCDNEHFPYGSKSESEVLKAVESVLDRFLKKCPVSHLVIACNTASTLALPLIRERFGIPVVGVVPAIKPAAALSTTKVIGLLATPGTVKRSYTGELIREFAPNCEVIRVGSSRLVTLAEEKLRGKKVDLDEVRREITPLFKHEFLDTVVLGCTHFPLLKEELLAAAPKRCHWLDSGEAIALRVRQILPTFPEGKAHYEASFSKNSSDLSLLKGPLSDFGIQSISVVESIS